MEDYLTVKPGEEIFGTIGMKPNAKNNVSQESKPYSYACPVLETLPFIADSSNEC